MQAWLRGGMIVVLIELMDCGLEMRIDEEDGWKWEMGGGFIEMVGVMTGGIEWLLGLCGLCELCIHLRVPYSH